MDKETLLGSVKRTRRMVTVEDGCKTGGVGAEISGIVCEEAYDDLKAPIRRVAALDVPLPANDVLEDATLPNERKIIDAVKSTLKTSASA
jgi:pyruvate/2-oxoglutarate/acetoin dehydrogenase E1 component